jgi:hypothetical protein
MTIGLDTPLAVIPPGEEITVYFVIAEPPSEVGAVKTTVAWLSPAVTEVMKGALGGPVGVAVLDEADGTLVPAEFVAVTAKV